MTNIDERAEFEKWAGKERDPLVFKVSGSGAYVYSGVQAGWEAWQARAALPTAGNNHIAVIRKMVDRQAEDEGLWFIAQYASEAYLQKALRKLHAVIESVPPEPTAELSEDEVVQMMFDAILKSGSDENLETDLRIALSALSNNGYKVVRK